jgi:NAD(P)-dependent dehydrogenase (short-subunit alcohol dehydrogenase family)
MLSDLCALGGRGFPLREALRREGEDIMNQGRLQNRVALVTGAARGIGRATAEKMLQEGASVALLDIQKADLTRTVEELKTFGKALGIRMNVTSTDEVDQAVDQIIAQWGRVDILVNNAGAGGAARLEDVTSEDWDRVVNVNLKGTFFCTRAVLPNMQKNRYGKIVNIGSRAGLGKEERTVYAATKAGLIGVTRTWALELARYNINVNYVGPGPIETEFFMANNTPEQTRAILSTVPLQRMGKPRDVANLISFLASDEASFITGQSIFICGGITVGLVHF